MGQSGLRALLFRRFPSHTPRQRVALCRSYLVLNQRAKRSSLSDRARSKPRETFEGTRYCRAIRSIACAAAGMKCLGWDKLFYMNASRLCKLPR